MPKSNRIPPPQGPQGAQGKARGVIILKQIQKHEWVFNYPRLSNEAYNTLEVAIDLMRCDARAAKSYFQRLIQEYPEFLDAYHHLALTWDRQGKTAKAAELWRQGIEFAQKLFPPNFSMEKDRLIWGFIENRPFLRLYHSYGLSLLKTGQTEAALDVFENLLSLNPNDNQGVRALAVGCYLELKRPDEALSICRQYQTDCLEHTLYGRVLALFQMGRLNEASKALRQATKHIPLVANELAKSTHKRPKDYCEDRVVYQSEGQAYGYWKNHGHYWKNTPGAIEFVRSYLQMAGKPQ